MFSDRVLTAARGIEVSREAANLYRATRSGRDGKPYLVHVIRDDETDRPRWIDCTCAHGRHASGHARCKHAVAVLADLGEVEL